MHVFEQLKELISVKNRLQCESALAVCQCVACWIDTAGLLTSCWAFASYTLSVSTFSCCYGSVPDRSNLREEGFARGLRETQWGTVVAGSL